MKTKKEKSIQDEPLKIQWISKYLITHSAEENITLHKCLQKLSGSMPFSKWTEKLENLILIESLDILWAQYGSEGDEEGLVWEF